MKKITLLDVEKRGDTGEPLISLLYGLGLVEYTKSESPLIIAVVKLFLKNRDRSLRYSEIINQLGNKNSKDKRSHIVKICRRLSSIGILEELAIMPSDKKRWERAYKYKGFNRAIKTIRRHSEDIFEQLEELSREVDR